MFLLKSKITLLAVGMLFSIVTQAHNRIDKESYAYSINNAHQIVGGYESDTFKGYILNAKGEVHFISPLPGDQHTVGNDINNSGDVVGDSYAWLKENFVCHGFIYNARSGIKDLGTLGGEDTRPVAINEKRQVVGSSKTHEGAYHAFLYTPEKGIIDLGTLGGRQSVAYDINDQGDVVGSSFLAGNKAQHAFLYQEGRGMIDLGTLTPDGVLSEAQSINNQGNIVGYSRTKNGKRHAFIYNKTSGMVDLGTFNHQESIANSINNKNEIVGTSFDTGSDYSIAFYYNPVDGMKDLGNLGFPTALALHINDNGDIAGFGYSPQPQGAVFHGLYYSKKEGIKDIHSLLEKE